MAAHAGEAPGVFLVLEGVDGAGTTTQCRRLATALGARGIAAHVTREPSDGPVGRLVRASLAPGGPNFPPAARALLFAADRLDHLASEVEPALSGGRWVVCDRYVLSTLAYQGRECDEAWVRTLNAQARSAHRTFLLDVPVDVALARITNRAAAAGARDPGPQLYERRDVLADLVERYRRLAVDDPSVVVVDGRQPPAAVTAAILDALSDLLPEAPRNTVL